MPFTSRKLADDMPVANWNPDKIDAAFFHCALETNIRHHRTNNSTFQDTALRAVFGNNIKQVIAIQNMSEMINHHDSVTITIEGNATGQLATLIKQQTGLSVSDQILKYDGRPFFYDELLKAISDKISSPVTAGSERALKK